MNSQVYDNGTFWNLVIVMIVQLYDYTKNTELSTLEG